MSFSPFTAILSCLGLHAQPGNVDDCNRDLSFYEKQYHDDDPQNIQAVADRFVSVLLTTKIHDRTDPQLHKALDESIGTCNWSEWLAERILTTLEKALKAGIILGRAMTEAADKAVDAAIGFARDHPIYTTLIALGILAIMVPEVLAWLGFAELGPVEGSWAALWQARYAGYVPKGSLFSFFQRLGMTWHWF